MRAETIAEPQGDELKAVRSIPPTGSHCSVARTRPNLASVTANGLRTSVCEIIDPDYGVNSRREVISTLAAWRGVHVGGFVSEHNADSKGKH